MQQRRCFPKCPSRWSATALLLAALTFPSLVAAVEITATLTDLTDTPAGDVWRVSYAMEGSFGYPLGHGISFEFPPGGPFEPVGGLNPGSGWGAFLINSDANLAAPAMLDDLAEETPLSANLGAINFVWTGAGGTPSMIQRIVVWDANFDPVETIHLQVPEPSGALSAAAALLALGLLASRSTRRRASSAGAAVALAALLVTTAAPASAEVVVGGPVHSTTLGDLEISYQPVEFDRITRIRWEYTFRVTVKNTGAPVGAFSLTVDDHWVDSKVIQPVVQVPALGTGESATATTTFTVLQDRSGGFFTAGVLWCVAEPAPAGLPDSDPAIAAIDQYIATLTTLKNDPDWRTMTPGGFPVPSEYPCARTYFWHLDIETGAGVSLGAMKLRLFPDVAKTHVSSTIYLTRLGFYDTLGFHRVIQGFMAQGGDPLGNGSGGPNYSMGSEFDFFALHDRAGRLSMANAGEGTDGSQVFILFGPRHGLDGLHTVFGEIVEGFDTLAEIQSRGALADPGVPSEPIVIRSATISVE